MSNENTRKRSLPQDDVPNRKVQKINLEEKEKIKRLAEEEAKRTFYLQPHNPWSTSLLAYVQQQQNKGPLSYPSLSVPVPPLFSPSPMARPSEIGIRSLSSTNDITPMVNHGMSHSYQYPISYTLNSQSSKNSTHDTVDPTTSASSPSADNEKEKDKGVTSESDKYSVQPHTLYPFMCSPHSPFLYMYNRSPISPMLLVGSPCPPSVASCPSVGSSSSGCSSMSEGSANNNSDVIKSGKSDNNGPRIAPSEYHVGITLPTQDASENEDGADSNPATPVDRSNCSDSLVESDESYKLTMPDTLMYNGLSTTSYIPPASSNSQVHIDSGVTNHTTSRAFYNVLEPGPSYGISSPTSSRGSTPEPDEADANVDNDHKAPYSADGDSDDAFCLVPGRLSLLSSTQKYKVTIDEVKRRLSNPECLNASVLGGILRRAKSKNGGHHLRQRLEAKGLSLPAGRRKQTELFLLTSLVEGEALHLAADFRRLCENFFPHSELAQIIGAQHISTPHVERRISMVQAAQVLIQELQAMVNTVGGPNNLRPNDPSNPYKGLTNFSLLSHGFGNPNISAVLSVIQNYFNELLKVYECNKVPMEPVSSGFINDIDSSHKSRKQSSSHRKLKQEQDTVACDSKM